jgi:hypothetical protein
MRLQFSQALCEGHVIKARQFVQSLIAQKEHLVFQQGGINVVEQSVVSHSVAQADIVQLRANGAG